MMIFRLKLLNWSILGLEFSKPNIFTFMHVVEIWLGVKLGETVKFYSYPNRSHNNMEITG